MSSSKGFDFATDDILCSYEDLNNQPSNGVHSDQSIVTTTTPKESLDNRTARSMLSPAYCPTEESLSQEVASAVEHTMKKHTDNVMRFLEGISSRLSQLELYCYNVDKSVGEMRCDLERDHSDADLKLRSLDKHLQEVRRSVKILKDKQELAETHKELAKLQFVQKETSSASNSQLNSERSASSTPDPPQKVETAPDMQLALALPHQVKPVEQQQTMPPPPQSMNQSPAYYVPAQLHYVQSDSHYQVPQMQDMSRVSHLPPQPQANQSSQLSLPQYQQQWVQQMPQQHQQQQQQQQMTSMQTQVRPQLTAVYPQYPPSQPANPTPESPPNSMPMQMTYPKGSQPGAGHTEATSYVYMGPNGTMLQQQQQPPQQAQYAYMVYEGESGRPRNTLQLPPQQSQYPPTSVSLQAPQASVGTNIMVRPPQFLRGHPHGEVIEKLVSMGYRADHVASVIQRLEESGQPVDFNAVIDRLNGHSSRGSQGGWSG